MVGRPGKYQPRFTSGELDENMQSNTDIKIYGTGASRMENVEVLPQGGFRSRAGLRQVARLRTTLYGVAYTGATFAAPSGGTAANAVDANPATTLQTSAISGTATVLTIQFPAATTISIVDLGSISCSTASGTVKAVATLAAGGTQQIGVATLLSATAKYLRAAMAPGVTLSVTRIDIICTGLAAASVITLGDVTVRVESGVISNWKLLPFTYSRAQAYDFVFSDYTIDVYGSAGYLTSIVIPHNSAQIGVINDLQSLETMILFHQDVQPQRVLRMGADDQWSVDAAPFANIPNADYGSVYTNGVPAEWDLEFFNCNFIIKATAPAADATIFVVTVNGNDSSTIKLDANTQDANAVAAAFKVLIEAIPGVNPGITVGYTFGGSGNFYGSSPVLPYFPGKLVVRFTGKGNEGDGWAVSVRAVNKSDAAVTAAHVTRGIAGGEPLISAARGWPKSGAITPDQRFLLGGFKSKPNAALASVTGDYFNVDTRFTSAAGAMLIPLNTSGAETIERIHIGRSVIFFTSDAEYFLADKKFDRTQTPHIQLASKNGIAAGIKAVESESASIFVHSNRASLYEIRYDYSQQNYAAVNISLTASSLCVGLKNIDLRKETAATDTNTLYAVKDDGTGLAVTLQRSEQITGFTRITTDGKLLDVAVNGRFDVSFITERTVAGQPRRFLERYEIGLWLDQAVSFTYGSPQTVITGLTDLEGASVWAIADGYSVGPFTVAGGTITIPTAASAVTVGRWARPLGRTLPPPRDVAPHTVVQRPARIHTVRVNVVNTTGLAIGANGGAAKEVPLRQFGQAVDVPMRDQPYTGPAVAEGILGFSDNPIAEITMLRPGAMTVTSVTVEVDL